MSHHATPHLNAARRRARKRTLAARDGAWCTYCGLVFTDLQEATIDHVVPISLFYTWAAEHLVLACRPCNVAKANRLPLLMALLLTTSQPTGGQEHATREHRIPIGEHGPRAREHHGAGREHGADSTPVTDADEHCVRGVDEQHRERVNRSTAPVFTTATGVLLARLAAAHDPVFRSTGPILDRSSEQSRGDLREHRLVRTSGSGAGSSSGSTPDRSISSVPVRPVRTSIGAPVSTPIAPLTEHSSAVVRTGEVAA